MGEADRTKLPWPLKLISLVWIEGLTSLSKKGTLENASAIESLNDGRAVDDANFIYVCVNSHDDLNQEIKELKRQNKALVSGINEIRDMTQRISPPEGGDISKEEYSVLKVEFINKIAEKTLKIASKI